MGTKKPNSEPQNKARRAALRRAFSFVGNIRQASARFGAALRLQRQKIGMTQAELSEISGLSRSFISEIECGHENISLERAEKLAKAVNSNLSDLLKE